MAEGRAGIAKCNQDKLTAAAKACDIHGIEEALGWAESGFIPEAEAKAQIQQAKEALASCSSLAGEWTIECWGRYRYWVTGEEECQGQGDGDFGRVFHINVTQSNVNLLGSGTDVTRQGFESLVKMEGTVADNSVVTFIVAEEFPIEGFEGFGYANLVHNFTGTWSRGEITGTFDSAFDYPTGECLLHYTWLKVSLQFLCSPTDDGPE